MSTKAFFLIIVCCLPLFGIVQAQEETPKVDFGIINGGIKDHMQQKVKSHEDSVALLNNQFVELKRKKDSAEFVRQINAQYEVDKSTTLTAIKTKNNDLGMNQETLQGLIGKIINKQVEFQGLFSQKDSIPTEQLQEINETIAGLGKPFVVDSTTIDKKTAMDTRYNLQQRNELNGLTMEYRKLGILVDHTSAKIQEGNLFLTKMDSYIQNRKDFIARANLIQKDFESEVIKKSQLINTQDSLITEQQKALNDEKQQYQEYKKQIIIIKDGKISDQEKGVFSNIENYLSKKITVDTVSLALDSISSKYFKEQCKQLLKLNIQLGSKRKVSQILAKRVEFLQNVNINLKNTLEGVYKQEIKTYESVIKDEDVMKTKVNNAKNGIFEEKKQVEEKKIEEPIKVQPDSGKPETKKRGWFGKLFMKMAVIYRHFFDKKFFLGIILGEIYFSFRIVWLENR